MGQGRCTFRKKDVRRAVAAVRSAGLDVAGVEFDAAGKFVVLTGKPQHDKTTAITEANEWDEVVTNGRDQAQTRK
jgi:hypothetical protein